MSDAVEIPVKDGSSITAKAAICPRINECPKIQVILDDELLHFQYAEAIRYACEHCDNPA